MRDIKENLQGSRSRWQYIRGIVIMTVLVFLFPVAVKAADGQGEEKTGYTIIVQQGTSGKTKLPDETPEAKSVSAHKKTAFTLQEKDAQHVLALAVCAMAIIWGGFGVVIYKIRQNKADEEYLAALRELYEIEMPAQKQTENKINHGIKVKYDRTDFFVGQRQI